MVAGLLVQIPLALRARFELGIPKGSGLSAELHFRELLRFLALKSIGVRGLEELVSEQLDLVWHSLILETRLYAEICDSLPVSGFIHHSGLNDQPTENHEASEHLRECFEAIVSYVANFGPFEETALELWPAVGDLRRTLGLTLGALNERLLMLGAHVANAR